MPAPVDPKVREAAVALVAAGHSAASAARETGVSAQAVRLWVAWERSRVPDDLETAPRGLESRCRGNGGNVERPGIYVGWSGRPDPEVRDHEGLRTAMDAWRSRVAHYGTEDLEERVLRAHDPCGRGG